MTMSRDERGAAAVEFALVAPLLVLLIFGIAEFGRAYYVQTMVSGSAREAVRVMALQDDPSAAIAAARSAASPLQLTDVVVTTSSTTTANRCTVPGGTGLPPTATVRITYTTSFITGLIGSGVTLRGTGVMRCGG